MRSIVFPAAVLLAAAAAPAQFFRPEPEPPRAWLPEPMTYPSKITADRLEAAEHPSAVRDVSGALWIAWSSCRPETDAWPAHSAAIEDWMWPDDGTDSIYIRRYDGKAWSDERAVSAVPGVNSKPVVVADGAGVRVLWTARRGGRWAAYERRFDGDAWSDEREVPGTAGAIEIRARSLDGGRLLAAARIAAAPCIELRALVWDGARWSPPERLDEGQGRCHRPHLLALAGGGWRVAWDEERDGAYDIFARRDGGPVERITDSTLWDTAPTQAVDAAGRAWIAWERREPYGGRFAYRGRSIFAKTLDAGRWNWAPSPFPASADPGRLTRHSEFWAAHAMSEERYPQLVARSNGDLWLFWLGGGRMSSVSFSGRVLRAGKWSEPKLVFHDPTPYTAFQLPSMKGDADPASSGRGPYQTPLANQFSLALDDAAGWLWAAYQVPRRRHITDRLWTGVEMQRPGGYGSDVYAHRIDLDERRARFRQVVDDPSPIPALAPRTYRRDPVRTLAAGGREYKLVWGDMHGHTENDGIGAFDMYYAHGLYVTGMDFVASTNHDYSPDFLTQSEWAEVQALAEVYNTAAGRVAFSGWEWTTDAQDERGGHRAMYFLRDDAPIFRSTTRGSDTVYKIYSLIRPWDVILQPHHNDWSGYDADLQPVFEITSAWRQAREEARRFKPRGPVSSVWEALERGYRIGFVGSGDSHWMGTGEDFGVTGAYVADLSREGVFEAIRARRVFASSGARMLLDFRVDGAPLGGQIEAPRGRPLKLEVRVEGDAPLDAVEIVKDHKVLHAVAGAGKTANFEFVDQSGPRADGKASYLYVRVRQTDGHYGWASPVWVDWK